MLHFFVVFYNFTRLQTAEQLLLKLYHVVKTSHVTSLQLKCGSHLHCVFIKFNVKTFKGSSQTMKSNVKKVLLSDIKSETLHRFVPDTVY